MSPTETQNLRTNVETYIREHAFAAKEDLVAFLKYPKHDATRLRALDAALRWLKADGRIRYSKVKKAWEPEGELKEAPRVYLDRTAGNIFEEGDYAVVEIRNGWVQYHVVLISSKTKNKKRISTYSHYLGDMVFDGGNGSRVQKQANPFGVPSYSLRAYDPKQHEDGLFDPIHYPKATLTKMKENLEVRNKRLAEMAARGV